MSYQSYALLYMVDAFMLTVNSEHAHVLSCTLLMSSVSMHMYCLHAHNARIESSKYYIHLDVLSTEYSREVLEYMITV